MAAGECRPREILAFTHCAVVVELRRCALVAGRFRIRIICHESELLFFGILVPCLRLVAYFAFRVKDVPQELASVTPCSIR